MAEVAEKIEELTVPEGGIADFIMEDEEADAVYGPDSDGTKEFGDDGIAQFPALTKKMAAMGREGDDSIAHVETGELIIPAALIADNEELKELLFERMREYGIEDPERYVVGSDSNSINPETGAYEFFLKKIFKAIKKVVKAVVKVVKKIAPIVLPIALSFTPLGPIFGSALGSGIGTLINGGSIKDALKSALISGAIGGVTAGFTGSGSFTENIANAASDFGGRFGQTVSGFTEGVSSGSLSGFGENFFAEYVPTPGAEVQAAGGADAPAADPAAQVTPEQAAQQTAEQATQQATEQAAQQGATQAAQSGAIQTIDKPPGFFESIKGALTPGDDVGFVEGLGDAFFPAKTTTADVLAANNINPVNATAAQLKGAEIAAQAANPGMFRTFAPLAAAGTLAAGATGMFEVPDAIPADFIDYNPDGTPVTGQDLIDADPARYHIADLGTRVFNPETGQYEDKEQEEVDVTVPATNPYVVPTQYPVSAPQGGYGVNNSAGYLLASNPGGPFARPYVAAAQGGAIPEVFPRRNGGIMPNEGTPGEDSVRAMLMPGEFVMTTDAVRGLGNGNLNNGIKNMYSVMRNLERRGRAMS